MRKLLNNAAKVKIIVVGDLFVTPEKFEKAAAGLLFREKDVVKILWKVKNKQEFQRKILNIEEHGPEGEDFPEELLYEIKDADILLVHFAPVPKTVIESAQKLKLIGICRGGTENIDVDTASKNKIPVIHVVRNAEAVAEFTIGLILCETRNIARSHEALKKGIWRKDFSNSEIVSTLKGKTVGIVGLGNIGKLVAKKLQCFDVDILVHDPIISKNEIEKLSLGVRVVTLEQLFRESDIITLHLRLTPETRNVINKDLISLMKPTAYLINTSRADIVVKEALYHALNDKKIGGAALDVFWEEPLPPTDPFVTLDNVTLTSHLAGTTVDSLLNSPFLLVEVINRYLKEGKSDLIVNKEVLT